MENRPNYYANIPANVRYDKDLTANAKLLYGEITALTNAEGYCWASNSYFADLYDMSTRNVSRLISQLNNKGYIRVEVLNEFERKIYLSIAHDKNVVPHEKNVVGVGQKSRRGQDENVQPPHDKNVYKNNTSINTTLNTTTNTKNTKKNFKAGELESEFDQLWKLYPRKMGKANALKSFIKARKKEKIPYEIIENGIYRYRDYLEAQGTEEQYIMHGSTWFGQMKWQDEYTTTGLNRKPKNATEYLQAKYGGNPYESYGNRKIIEYDTEIIPEPF
jgi:Helix-turn-helix domain